jgi:hypothetical protein
MNSLFKKIFLLAFVFNTCDGVFANQTLPILKSDSGTIIIKINGNEVGIWHIEPDTKPSAEPDLFIIERSFGQKKVSHVSNCDSVSFLVKPGGRYPFTILVNNKAFTMEIGTFSQPFLLQGYNLILILFVLAGTNLFIYIKRKKLKTSALLYFGIISPLLFWLVTFSGAIIHGNYNPLQNTISELGAIGTKSQLFMSVSELLIAQCSILSIMGFIKACRHFGISTLPGWSLLSLSISMIWAAIFPMHHELHGAIGPIPLLFNLGLLLALILWKGKQFYSMRLISFIALFFVSLILLRTISSLRNDYEGLIQRFYYLGWSVWSVSLSLIFQKSIKSQVHFPGIPGDRQVSLESKTAGL